MVARATCIAPEQNYKSRSTPKKHTIYRTDKGIKLYCIFFFFFFFFTHFKRKKRTAFELPGSIATTWRAELITAWLCTWSTSVLVLRAEQSFFVANDFGLSKLEFSRCVDWPSTYTQATAKFLFRELSAVQDRFFEGNRESTYGALRKSIDCQAFEGITHQLQKFSKK